MLYCVIDKLLAYIGTFHSQSHRLDMSGSKYEDGSMLHNNTLLSSEWGSGEGKEPF